MIDPLERNFLNPPAECRALPFWSWNGRMSGPKIRRQIREFKQMGYGGFFMHSRIGLETPYLGTEWFDCVRHAVDEARKLSLSACLYDEDRWASGFAGGLVTRNPEFKATALYLRPWAGVEKGAGHLTPAANGDLHPNRLGLWAAHLEGYTARDLRSIAAPGELRPEETLLEAFYDDMPVSERYNNHGYLDVLNPRAVKEFLDVTHEKYRSEVGEHFGTIIPSIFTDEPHFKRFMGEKSIDAGYAGVHMTAWTSALPERFRGVRGLELTSCIPELFYDCPGREFARTRYCYYQVVTELFLESYTKQIGAWCERHGIEFTGHFLWEDSPVSQSRTAGSVMRHFEYMHVPGIDQLTEYEQLYDACKQAASAGRQFGRKWRISEVYGCTGWDTPLLAYKAMADWQYVLGINRRCLHLSFYTLAGEAKRDYPASFSPHSNFSRVSNLLEDYFARLGLLLSEGEEVRDLLVVSPVESAWVLLNTGLNVSGSEVLQFDAACTRLRNRLLGDAIDFDYGEEDILARHAEVLRQDGQALLKVGHAVYRAVLLPGLVTVRPATLRLLREFLAAGGAVAYEGRIPTLCDGRSSGEPAAFYAGLPCGADTLEPLIRRVRFTAGDGRRTDPLLYQLREKDGELTLAVCNTGFELPDPGSDRHNVRCVDRRLAFPALTVELAACREGEWYEYDLETGASWRVESRYEGDRYVWQTAFAPLQTRVFRLKRSAVASSQSAPSKPVAFPSGASVPLTPTPVPVRLNEPNTLVLDHAAYRLGQGHEQMKGKKQGEWTACDFILRVDDAVRRALNVPVRSGRMVQPWMRRQLGAASPEASLELCYEFDIAALPPADLRLAVEEPGNWTFWLNGSTLPATDLGMWIDDAIRQIAIPHDLLRIGTNRLILNGIYHTDGPGLEAMYLLGDFGVENDSLCRAPERLQFGDWGRQGLPYYAGDVAYYFRFHPHSGGARMLLRLGRFAGTAVRVFLNGEHCRDLGWEPFETVLDGIRQGENELVIEVIGSRRNVFGPFFLQEPYPKRFGPEEFRAYCHPEYRNLTPYGLLEPPVLLAETI